MPVEFIGWIAPRVASEIIPPSGPVWSNDVIAQTAQVHEAAGFDRVLIGYFSNAPDGFLVGAHAAASTDRLGMLLAHRPGFVAPTVAARKLATLDQLSGGRLAVHIISGGADSDQAKDGDYLGHAERYQRSAEYVQVLRRTWTSAEPFDHHGDFYRVDRAWSDIRCVSPDGIPVYGGGGSDAAVELLTPGLDVFMLWGEPLAETAQMMERVRAAKPDGTVDFSVSTRPILAATDAEAWERAYDILDRIGAGGRRRRTPRNVGSQRLLDIAERGDVHDSCLWTAPAAATGAPGNTTALVGSPETVAQALLGYHRLGATSLLIRGFDPLPDAIEYGTELIGRVRQLVAADDAASAPPDNGGVDLTQPERTSASEKSGA